MSIEVQVPEMGESVKQATLIKWHKNDGDAVKVDEPLCELETDKANVDIPAKAAGVLHPLIKVGQIVNVGEVIAQIEASTAAAAAAASTAPKSPEPRKIPPPPAPIAPPPPPMPRQQQSVQAPEPKAEAAMEDYAPAVRRLIQENKLDPKSIPGSGPSGRLTKQDVETFLTKRGGNGAPALPAPPAPKPAPSPIAAPPSAGDSEIVYDNSGIHRAPMSRIRKRIAETLVHAQHTAAILTTFNEIDLTAVIDLRTKFKDRFQEVHGVGLGFMSFFAHAVVLALREFPRLNAFIEGDDIVYHQYVHLGIAVSTDRGLAVPVLRNADKMSFAKVESEIKRLAAATREGKLALHELAGGTFTITNGGIFGSLLSTPIINPPQSGILGMHVIQKRPVVMNDKIEIRSMMYVALSYDHRLVDGRESVSFLVRLKQFLEDPTRLMLEI